jgi:hypothetical protein
MLLSCVAGLLDLHIVILTLYIRTLLDMSVVQNRLITAAAVFEKELEFTKWIATRLPGKASCNTRPSYCVTLWSL